MGGWKGAVVVEVRTGCPDSVRKVGEKLRQKPGFCGYCGFRGMVGE
jgi:hypothetical protein